jgi:hypothetical protein
MSHFDFRLNFPCYVVHPGTDECPCFAKRRVVSEHNINIGGAASARLELRTASFDDPNG